MHVGIYVADLHPLVGGAQTYQTDILTALLAGSEKSEHRLTFFTSDARQIPSSALEASFVRLPSNFLDRIGGALKLVLMDRPTSVIVRRLGGFRYRSVLDRAAQKAGIDFMWFLTQTVMPVDIPYAVPVWDLQHRLQPWFPEVSARAEWEARDQRLVNILGRASMVIVGTEVGRAEVANFYSIPQERIAVLPLPTPKDAIAYGRNPSRASTRQGTSEGYLLYPAQFWTHKNHVTLLRALAVLRDDRGVRVNLILTGSEKNNLDNVNAKIAELDLAEQVHIYGFIERKALLELYGNAIALVFPSFFGPDNLPPLEAFAVGTPVIAARVSGSDEQLGEAALFFDPTDPDALADSIQALMADPALRRDLVARGRARAAEWTGDHFAEEAFRLLRRFELIRRVWL